MKIAVFGGSFNPVHKGHTGLAVTVKEKLELDRLIIVPAYVSPFKSGNGAAAPQQRLEMCRLAFEKIPCAEVSDIEICRGGASDTYLTLEELSETYRNDQLFFVTGADMFLSIHTWKYPERIFKRAAICGIPRNDCDSRQLEKQAAYLHTLGAETVILDVSVMTVSSTQVREAVRNGEDISAFVDDKVAAYIRNNGLYRQKPTC